MICNYKYLRRFVSIFRIISGTELQVSWRPLSIFNNDDIYGEFNSLLPIQMNSYKKNLSGNVPVAFMLVDLLR